MKKFAPMTAAVILTATLAACQSGNTTVTPIVQQQGPIAPSGTPGTMSDLTGSASGVVGNAQRISNGVPTQYQQLSEELAVTEIGTLNGAQPAMMLNALMTAAKVSTGALSPMQAKDLAPLAKVSIKLPTGDYTCTKTKCILNAANEDLIIHWKTKSGKDATLTVDLNGSSQGAPSEPTTMVVSEGSGDTQEAELPTHLYSKLVVDSKTVAEVDFTGTWDKQVGSYSTPTFTSYSVYLKKVSFKGFLTSLDGSQKLVDVASFKSELNFETGLKTSGDVTYQNGSDKVQAKWDINLAGQQSAVSPASIPLPIFFAPSNSAIKITGDSSVAVSLDLNGKVYATKFTTKNWVYETKGSLETVKSADFAGKVSLEGKLFEFSGTMDDANQNCIPGENINVTFSGETKTFEAISQELLGMKTCAVPTPPSGN